MRIVLGVTGGIAAYKACSLLRRFTEGGHEVTVVPTPSALEFVGKATWEALSGRPVTAAVFDRIPEVNHVRLGQQADLVVVAPATADVLARAAHGLADDLLTNVLLTARCPIVFAPAMHTEMWSHPATRANVAILRERGAHVIEPASGRLTGADSGPGRLPEPEEIHDRALAVVDASSDGAPALQGVRVVVTAGGTREPLDPVRYLGNRSSGKQGYALAQAAAARGADVRLVSTVDLPPPAGVERTLVETARELQDAVHTAAKDADVVIMAAAVADFRPATYAEAKIKKAHDGGPDAPEVSLVRNPDILAELVTDVRAGGLGHPGPLLVGFAAETGDASGSVLDHARVKLERKGADLLVANEVGVGVTFGRDDTTVHLLTPDGAAHTVGPTTKLRAAGAVCDRIARLLGDRAAAGSASVLDQ